MRNSDVEQFRKLENEWEHVSLNSRIIAKRLPSFPGLNSSRDKTWVQYKNRQIFGAIFISGDGIVLPVFTFLTKKDKEFLRRLLLISPRPIFSIMGNADNVRTVERILHEQKFDSQNYHMLTLSPNHFTGVIPDTNQQQPTIKNQINVETGLETTHNLPLSIHRATPGKINLLWPLERDYILEEVLRPGMKLNEKTARKRFQHSLQKEIIHYAKIGTEAVAKAGTNASSWNYDQLGGVYVKPSLRGHGIALKVMESLIRDPVRKGRSCCLFVKPDNHAALKLYEKLKFIRRTPFRISYLNFENTNNQHRERNSIKERQK